MRVSLDNLIFSVQGVTPFEFSKLVQALEVGDTYGVVPSGYKQAIGKGFSSYHHNLNVGEGGGAIHIGWKHNSQKENQGHYDMRVEFNPSKQSERFDWFWEQFHRLFQKHRKMIREFDLAFDIPEIINNISVISLTGRDRSLFKNTQYFGASGLHGRLKVYDKKKEMKQRQGIEVQEENLTRIEYTVKFSEPLHYNFLKRLESFNINDDYTISTFNIEGVDGPLKASLLAIQGGQMEMKEFGRRYKVKIKEALKNMEQLNLDHAYMSARKEFLETIYYYVQ